MSEIEEAARNYIQNLGWVPIALENDTEGRPKKPIFPDWQNLTLDNPDVRRQGWSKATGVGVACGPQSNNLAIIDIDDQELALEIFAKLVRSKQDFRWVWTIRKRGHLYVYERTASKMGETRRNYTCIWKGREVKLECRFAGAQVAAPGTPGYILARDVPPQTVDDVTSAFSALSLVMGLEPSETDGGRNYPEPWQDMVGEGSRNDSLFIEACRLAGVKIPEERAVELLTANVGSHYSGYISPIEIRRTVHSAYRRVSPKILGPAENERYRREIR